MLAGYGTVRYFGFRLLVALRLQQPRFGRTPDLVHPRRYNEKIRWRMLHDRRPLLRVFADKVAVRDYVAERIGESYLVPLLGIFDRPEDIPWERLSPPYVVKATHGCEWNIFVRDAAEVDPDRFSELLRGWLARDYYYVAREWAYKRVPRRVIVERFIGSDGRVPSDYKFYCFDGEPRAVAVCHDRFRGTTWAWFDPSWTLLPWVSKAYGEGTGCPPPSRLEEMLEVARALSADIEYVRVDLYCVGDRVYFGELTATEAAGSWPLSEAGEAWLGGLWRLPR